MPKSKPLSERYRVDTSTGCWVWLGKPVGRGYAYGWVGGKFKRMHRHMYELRHGACPSRLVLDHLCRNKLCINPDHLEAVSQAVNVRRGNGPKLNAEQRAEIQRLYAQGIKQGRIAEQFGVTRRAVWALLAGESWSARG